MSSDVIEQAEICLPRKLPGPTTIARAGELLVRFPEASRGLLSIVDQAVVSGTSFATAIIINRAISLDELGVYYLTLSIVFIALGVQEHLVSAPYTIFSKRFQSRELAQYTASAWMHHLALNALGVIALGITISVLSIAGSGELVPGMWALAGAGPLLLLREAVRRFAFANLRLFSALAMDIAIAVLQLAGLAALAWLGRLNIYTIYAVMGAASALACLGWYLLDGTETRLETARVVPDWWRNWSFGKWALRSYLVGNTTPYIMPWILDFASGTAATGVLGACATLVNITNVFSSGVDRVLTPRAAQAYATGGWNDLRRVLLVAATAMVVLLGGFCVLLLASGSRLAVLVYGPSYEGAGPILIALALSAVMNGISTVAGNGLWAIERPRANFFADVCALGATLVCAALLVGSLGALGAALAILAGTSTAAVTRSATLRHAIASLGLESRSPIDEGPKP